LLHIFHINNYLILVLTKLKWVYGCIFSEKVVMEISALKVRVFGKKWQKPHASLTQKQQRTHDLTYTLIFM